MKEYRSSTGEWRLWFEENEIEWMMEDELRKAGLFPCLADPVVDLQSLLEIHFGVKLDLHAVLDDDVLGVTHFLSGKKPLGLHKQRPHIPGRNRGSSLGGSSGDGGLLWPMKRGT